MLHESVSLDYLADSDWYGIVNYFEFGHNAKFNQFDASIGTLFTLRCLWPYNPFRTILSDFILVYNLWEWMEMVMANKRGSNVWICH